MGERDRMAAGVLSVLLNHRGDGEMERNIKMEMEADDDLDGQCHGRRDRKNYKDRKRHEIDIIFSS